MMVLVLHMLSRLAVHTHTIVITLCFRAYCSGTKLGLDY